MSEEMPDSVNELIKTPGGRKDLERLQKKYAKEILQPTNPDGSRNSDFFKVYGKDIQKRIELKEEQKREADKLWKSSGGKEAERRDKANWEAQKRMNPGVKKYR